MGSRRGSARERPSSGGPSSVTGRARTRSRPRSRPCTTKRATAADTDWAQIADLYRTLVRLTPTPVVELNLAAAVAMADGPAYGLAMMDGIAASGDLDGYPYLPAARADLLRRLERWSEAEAAYRQALALTTNGSERAFLEGRLAEMEVRQRASGGNVA